jgi:hypothetical protein
VREIVVHVIRIEERDEHVDVEQRNAGHRTLGLVAEVVDELHGGPG